MQVSNIVQAAGPSASGSQASPATENAQSGAGGFLSELLSQTAGDDQSAANGQMSTSSGGGHRPSARQQEAAAQLAMQMLGIPMVEQAVVSAGTSGKAGGQTASAAPQELSAVSTGIQTAENRGLSGVVVQTQTDGTALTGTAPGTFVQAAKEAAFSSLHMQSAGTSDAAGRSAPAGASVTSQITQTIPAPEIAFSSLHMQGARTSNAAEQSAPAVPSLQTQSVETFNAAGQAAPVVPPIGASVTSQTTQTAAVPGMAFPGLQTQSAGTFNAAGQTAPVVPPIGASVTSETAQTAAVPERASPGYLQSVGTSNAAGQSAAAVPSGSSALTTATGAKAAMPANIIAGQPVKTLDVSVQTANLSGTQVAADASGSPAAPAAVCPQTEVLSSHALVGGVMQAAGMSVSQAISADQKISSQAQAQPSVSEKSQPEAAVSGVTGLAAAAKRSADGSSGAGDAQAGSADKQDGRQSNQAGLSGQVFASALTGQPVSKTETIPQQTAPQNTAGAQVADAVKNAYASQQSTLRVHLSPEDLGGITIKMVSQGGTLSVSIVADSHHTGQMLASGLDGLKTSLQNSGVPVQKAEVSYTHADTGQTAYSQQQTGQNSQQHSRHASYFKQQERQEQENTPSAGFAALVNVFA